MMKELNIDSDGLSITEMDKEVREEIDKQFNKKKLLIGNVGKSDVLLRFMNEEYDFFFYNKSGDEVDFRGNKK